MKSNTQIIWQDLLKMPDYKAGKPPKIIDDDCWLCGWKTNGEGWSIAEAIGNAFTDHPAAKASHSRTVCNCCAALTSKDAWVMACDRHRHNPFFPVKDDKKPFLSNWMFSSHVFAEQWRMPSRSEAREFLINPPQPPFVMTFAAAGKKHVIFRAQVNYSRELFSVQLDENQIAVDLSLFLKILDDFEKAYSIGLSKDSLVTGNYNFAACMKIGVERWRSIEDKMSLYRHKHPGMLTLAGFCAQKDETIVLEPVVRAPVQKEQHVHAKQNKQSSVDNLQTDLFSF